MLSTKSGNVLIIIAHPDDEVLGMGGTIKKLSAKNKIHLCVVTDGASAQYQDKKMIDVRRNACKKAGKILNIKNIEFLDFPDMKLDTVPHIEINNKLEKIVKKIRPKLVFTTPKNDYNKDHKIVYESTLVATRPHQNIVDEIFSFEMPAYSKQEFSPTVFVNITKELQTKIKALKMYKSEIRKFPHPRSFDAIKALAMYRGIQSNLKYAEGFECIRSTIR